MPSLYYKPLFSKFRSISAFPLVGKALYEKSPYIFALLYFRAPLKKKIRYVLLPYMKKTKKEKRFLTSTPKGLNGFNISYDDEERCAKSILEQLPKEWKIKFSWFQILFSDVSYHVDREKKLIVIGYNQNLRYWWPQLERDVLLIIRTDDEKHDQNENREG